jgi:hypothetical protein
MPEFEELIRHQVDPQSPAPSLDQLFHRTRMSERRERIAWGVVGALVVVSVVLLATVWVALHQYHDLSVQQDYRTQVRNCRDEVFAITADEAFTTGNYPQHFIIREYHRCDVDPHHKIPRP